MKKLIIAEKPSLARMIKAALPGEKWFNEKEYSEGTNYVITSCYGHLLTLYDFDDYFNREKSLWTIEELPFIPPQYKYKVKDDSAIKHKLKIIGELIAREDISSIISAGDPDEEGELLIRETIDYCMDQKHIRKKIERLWFTEQNEPSIRKDIKNLRPINEFDSYSNKALTRGRIDWLVGIEYTRALSLLVYKNTQKKITLPTGRVLGCIVKYMYDRYQEQKNFVSEKYFDIGLIIKDYNLKLVLKDVLFKAQDEYKAYELINRLNKGETYVESVTRNQVKKQAPKLFSLTTLQTTLSKRFKYSNQETLKTAQSLYEGGYLTYPRAKSEYLQDNDKEKVNQVIEGFKAEFKDLEFRDTKHIFDSSKVGTDHSALIPTVKIPDLNTLSEREKNVYITIRNRFLANFCSEECIIEENKIVIKNTLGEDNKAELRGKRIIKEGYLKYEKLIEEKELPNLKEGDKLKAEYTVNECMTKPPANVSTSELNKFLESPFSKEDETEEEKYKKILSGLEIGTTATRASIIENAKKYGYIEESKGIFKITQKGIYYIETAEQLGLNMSVKQTAELGVHLQSVFDNKLTVDQCVNITEKEVTNKINSAKKIDGLSTYNQEVNEISKCPVCNKSILESAKAFYCEGFKDKSCDFALFKKDIFLASKGKTLTTSTFKKLVKNNRATIKGLKRKDGSTYDADICYVKNDKYYNITFAEKIEPQAIATCPRCGKKIIEGVKNYYCEGYKDSNPCSYKLWKSNKILEDRGIKITKAQFKKLLEGKIITVKAKSKKGTDYEVELSLNDTGTYVNYNINFKK